MMLLTRARLRSLLTVAVVLIILSIVIWYFFFRSNNTQHISNVDYGPSTADLIQPGIKNAQAKIKIKDYKTAANYFYAAAVDAMNSQQPKIAESILRQAMTQIPAKYLPFYIYDEMVAVARQLKDTSLEKQSLEKAIQIAEKPGSGIRPDQIAAMKNQLQELK